MWGRGRLINRGFCVEKVAINILSSGVFLYSANNYCRARPVLIDLSVGRF